MDVIDTTFEIVVIAYLMLPKASLPKIDFPSLNPRCTADFITFQQMLAVAADMGFDYAPSFAISGVVLRQRPDGV